MFLPLVDTTQPLSPDALSGLRQFGAFRLAAPQISQLQCDNVFSTAQTFFGEDLQTKERTAGYSAIHAERVRGKIPIPKESIYLIRKDKPSALHHDPPADLVTSVEALHENWKLLREDLLSTLLSQLQEGTPALAEDPFLEHDHVGINYYNSQQLHADDDYFNPPHKDSGLFTVLLLKPGDGADGLEIADLDSTEETGSEAVGQHATFRAVSLMPGEVLVLAGNAMQRLFGADRVRACVHRVRRPAAEDAVRLTIAIFCALPWRR